MEDDAACAVGSGISVVFADTALALGISSSSALNIDPCSAKASGIAEYDRF